MPAEPPEGCIEIPGFILVVKDKGWLTKDGMVTNVFCERGVWESEEDAEKALESFTEDGKC